MPVTFTSSVMVLRRVAEAFCRMVRLEAACRYQVDDLAGNVEMAWLSEETIARSAASGARSLALGGHAEVGKLEWGALIRKLERDRGTSYKS